MAHATVGGASREEPEESARIVDEYPQIRKWFIGLMIAFGLFVICAMIWSPGGWAAPETQAGELAAAPGAVREKTREQKLEQAMREERAREQARSAAPAPTGPVLTTDGTFTVLSTDAWSTSVVIRSGQKFGLTADFPIRVQVTLRDGEVRDFTINDTKDPIPDAYRRRYPDDRIATDVTSVALRATSAGQQGRVNVK